MFGNLYSKKPKFKACVSSQRRDAFDVHLDLTWKIETTYRNRDSDAKAIEETVSYCKEQIAIAEDAKRSWLQENRSLGLHDAGLPEHRGYKQLSIIFEKQGLFQEAIRVAEQAKLQGWSGDWDKRIKRCGGKLLKANK